MEDDYPREPITFIVRASQDNEGRLRGMVERVRTGQKEPFEGAEALARVVADLLRRERGEGAKAP